MGAIVLGTHPCHDGSHVSASHAPYRIVPLPRHILLKPGGRGRPPLRESSFTRRLPWLREFRFPILSSPAGLRFSASAPPWLRILLMRRRAAEYARIPNQWSRS